MVAPTEKQEASASSEDENDDPDEEENDDSEEDEGHDLLTASYHGQTSEARRLLESDIDVNYADEHGSTAQHYAAGQGRSAIVKLLLEWGANPNVEDEDDETPLDRADDDDQIVRLLQLAGAKHVEKAESTYEQEHALRKAAFDGDLGEVRRLIKLGTDFHAMGNFRGGSALHKAASMGHIAVMEFLLKKGIDINADDTCMGETALTHAHDARQTEAAEFLKSRGAKESGCWVGANEKSSRDLIYLG